AAECLLDPGKYASALYVGLDLLTQAQELEVRPALVSHRAPLRSADRLNQAFRFLVGPGYRPHGSKHGVVIQLASLGVEPELAQRVGLKQKLERSGMIVLQQVHQL